MSPGGSSPASSALSSACAFSLTALPLKSIKEPSASETARGNKPLGAGSEQAPHQAGSSAAAEQSDCSTSKGCCMAPLPQAAPGDTDQAAAHPQRSSFGLGRKEVLQSEGATRKSDRKSSPLQGGAHRSSLEDMRQAQLALASFPGHLTESQASAVAGVRSRLREMAQGSAGAAGSAGSAGTAGACTLWSAPCSAGMVSPWESACGQMQRLSVVVGARHSRAASACPADYCAGDTVPFESASSLSLPEDTFRAAIEEHEEGSPDREQPAHDAHSAEEKAISDRPGGSTLPALEEAAADKQAPRLLGQRESPFQASSNSTGAAGEALAPGPGAAASKRAGRRTLFAAGSLNWRPWGILVAVLAWSAAVLPLATVLAIAVATLVFVVAWSPAGPSPARLPSDEQGKILSFPHTRLIVGPCCCRHSIAQWIPFNIFRHRRTTGNQPQLAVLFRGCLHGIIQACSCHRSVLLGPRHADAAGNAPRLAAVVLVLPEQPAGEGLPQLLCW